MDTLSKIFGKLTIPLLVLLAISFFASTAHAKYGGGTGEPNDPYLIYDANQMNEIGLSGNWDDRDKHFKLMADIDLSAFTGTSFNIIQAFTGVFDGNNHTISNFTYSCTGEICIGIFESVSGVIKDLGLIAPDVDVENTALAGSLAGQLVDGTICGCYVQGGSVAGYFRVGGLVAENTGTISDCDSSASVSGSDYVGGCVGENYGIISDCSSSASVSGDSYVGGCVGENEGIIANSCATASVLQGSYAGGLVGYNWGTISNCYAAGGVSGGQCVGGLVGRNGRGTITNSYTTASVSGNHNVGGLVGRHDGGSYIKSFWDYMVDLDLTGIGNITDPPEVISKSTEDMQEKTTFTDAGWDFVDTWDICEGTNYPRLLWQVPAGDLICPYGIEMRDFAILGAQWRQPPGEPSADIAPDGGDGIVNWLDLAALVDNWLAGVNVEPPSQASNPNPADGATEVNTTADLIWTAGSRAPSHDVYFGTNPAPGPGEFQRNQTETTFDPGPMAPSTTYYWRIDEVGPYGSKTTGTVWSFTTMGLEASNPHPADGATDIDINADLSWTAGADATSHDVYFGTSSPPPFIRNQILATFDPGTMVKGTTYFWRVDEVNPWGTTTGTVWSFTTESGPPPP